MKQTVLLSLLLTCIPLVSKSQEVLSSQGGSYVNFYGAIDFTVGELVINTFDNGSNGLTQGFHQTNLVISNVYDLTTELKVSVYPNPVLYQLTLAFSELQFGYDIEILDMNGKMVKTLPVSGLEIKVDVQSLAAGVYMLMLKDEEGNYLKTYQIHKLN
jgi:hypothetical protein